MSIVTEGEKVCSQFANKEIKRKLLNFNQTRPVRLAEAVVNNTSLLPQLAIGQKVAGIQIYRSLNLNMGKRTLFLLLFIILYTLQTQAQLRPILFGGIDYYRDTGFQNNAYMSLNVGSQVFKWHFLAPEIGFEHYYGLVDENSELNPNDPNARAPSKLDTRFSTNSFSIAPKLIFGDKEAALVVIPQYNIGKITARGDLLKDTGDQYVLEERQRISESISYASIAAGVEGQFFESEVLYFSLLLKYNFLNSEKTLKKIEIPQSDLNSTGGSSEGLGISFRVYFDFFELFKK